MSGVESESCDSVFSAERQRSMSGLLPGTLKYSWYKYCKAIRLIKALVFINEVTEGSIDQACHEDFLLCHFFLCLPSPHSHCSFSILHWLLLLYTYLVALRQAFSLRTQRTRYFASHMFITRWHFVSLSHHHFMFLSLLWQWEQR